MLPSNYRMLGHDLLLHDEDKPPIDALVASGDLFVTLATELDGMPVSPLYDTQLEALTRTLLYLQRHYQVVKKPANYRQ